MKKNIFYSIIFILLSFSNLLAVDSQIVTGKNGKDLFNFKFFDKGEEAEDFNGSKISTYTLNSEEKKAVLDAGKYWSEVLNTDNALLSTINVYTLNDANAYATSITVEKGDAKGMMELQAKILGKSFNPHLGEAVATIGIGIMGFKTGAPSNLPNAEGVNLYGTIVHEIAHTLGIMSTANFYEDEKFRFGDVLSNFDKGLIDNNDRKISDTTGISYIDNNGNLIGNPETDFDASANVYFVGKNVDEVLKDSSLEGVPVNVGLEGYYDELPPAPELSHLEMDRGLMSHQQYRSYTTFMEAELAVLQDIGYTIDRRNFFGYSVYGNDSTIDNYNGYFLRDEKGEKYITGKYNTASYGVGLHVYGSRNNIVQKADLLTSGIAGIGIRIDGVGNKITVDRGIKVNADGDYGTGILVAYGKEHNITNNGEIKARGNQGIGVRFDFGSNTLGKDWAYMGSYILFLSKEDCSKPENLEYAEINGLKLGEINGALVENFNTSGYIEGKYASLYMSENAYVKNINVFDGAVLKGNIISMYKPKMEFGNNTITTETNLNLGLDKNDTSKGDSNFSFKFDDNIIGKNIVLNMAGGTSSLNGQNEILRVVVKDGAVLKGNARYILEENGSFVNKGTVAPGNSIGKMIIEGNYSQEDNGKLNIEFDGNGNHDVLEIVGNASFSSGSSMTMTPLKSYYGESMKIDKDQFLKVTGTQNGNIDNLTFDDKIFASSSTIKKVDFDFLTSKMTVLREENPYSRFSENRNAENFAKAIDRISNQASGSIKDFIGALDFASPSVVSSALSQAAPNIYGNNIIATFESEKEHSDYIRNHLLAEKNHEKDKSYAFGKLFYKENWQKGTEYLMGYNYKDQGVVAGVEKEYREGLILYCTVRVC